ncbi:MAG: ribonuclease P protein component [Parcubacteria group bacterium]
MLKKINRINQEKDFDRFFGLNFKKAHGLNLSAPNLIMKLLKSDLKRSRFGFIIPNKIDKRANVRNRIKRQMREIVRLNLPKIKITVDGLFLVKPGIKKMAYKQIEKEIVELFLKARIF